MTNQNTSFTPQIADDEKITPIMVYTSHGMVWGDLFSKKAIRVSSWLLTDMAPAYLKIYNAQILLVGGSQSRAPTKQPVLYLQTKGINAFHLMPPNEEGADYDLDEPNRKMVPTTAYAGYFRFDGFSRMASFTIMDNFLGAAKGEYITIYDITMTSPMVPSIKGIKAPMILLRQERVMFAVNED